MRLRRAVPARDGVDVRREDGFSLIELLVTMSILGVVLTGIASLFVTGINSENDVTTRARAEAEVGQAIDRLRRDLHSGCKQSAAYAANVSSITILGPNPACLDSSGNDSSTPITWCTRQVGTATRYQLFRIVGSTCTGGTMVADYFISPTPFTYFPYNVSAVSAPNPCNPACNVLARLHIDASVDLNPGTGPRAYQLVTDVAFRNSRP
jgi:prepilin-type N-terminal cleavage/methylation domain-containing protein